MVSLKTTILSFPRTGAYSTTDTRNKRISYAAGQNRKALQKP